MRTLRHIFGPGWPVGLLAAVWLLGAPPPAPTAHGAAAFPGEHGSLPYVRSAPVAAPAALLPHSLRLPPVAERTLSDGPSFGDAAASVAPDPALYLPPLFLKHTSRPPGAYAPVRTCCLLCVYRC